MKYIFTPIFQPFIIYDLKIPPKSLLSLSLSNVIHPFLYSYSYYFYFYFLFFIFYFLFFSIPSSSLSLTTPTFLPPKIVPIPSFNKIFLLSLSLYLSAIGDSFLSYIILYSSFSSFFFFFFLCVCDDLPLDNSCSKLGIIPSFPFLSFPSFPSSLPFF